METEKISCDIVIVNHNTKEKILICLDSLFSNLPEGCEVWVVDNESSDGSIEAIQRNFPRAKRVISEKNLGYAGGNNLGTRAGKGEYIVFLNPDTRVEEGWLKELLAPLKKDAKVGLSTPKILLMDRPGQINACGNSVHPTGLTLCRGLGIPKGEFTRSEEVAAVSGAACAIRRDLFERLGGFDEEMFLYMEDTDLSWRVWLSGHSCVLAPESIVYHDYALRLYPEKIFLQERNRYLMLLKNLKWPTLLLLIPPQMIAEIIAWVLVIFQKPSSFLYKWKAYPWIALHWRSIMRKRKITQSLRKVGDREFLKRTNPQIDFFQVRQGFLARAGHLVINPIFLIYHRFCLGITRW